MAGLQEAIFRENMKRVRERSAVSQTELARRMKALGFAFHQQTVQRVESGERPVRLDEAYAIADILKTSMESMTRAPRADVSAAVYAIEKLRSESAKFYDVMLEVNVAWNEAFDDVYGEFTRFAPHTVEQADEWATLLAAWTLKGARVFEAVNDLLICLKGLFNDESGGDWHERLLTYDVPASMAWLQDESAEPWRSLPESARPLLIADREPWELMDRTRALSESVPGGERQGGEAVDPGDIGENLRHVEIPPEDKIRVPSTWNARQEVIAEGDDGKHSAAP